MKKAYECLADYFEYLNDDCDYYNWSQYLINLLNQKDALKYGIDVGCGSGYFTRRLEKSGYSMLGVDVSQQMLSKAVQLSQSEGLHSNYILQDVKSLKVDKKYDFAVSINDCFNYIPTEKLVSTFKKVYNALKPNAPFIFDISSEYKLKNIVGNNLFGEDTEDVTYLWFNTLKEHCVEMDITMFVKDSQGRYEKREENHIQYIHTEQAVLKSLDEAGFAVEGVYGHLGEVKTPTAQRLNFICKRT